jgi:hypothetical protein
VDAVHADAPAKAAGVAQRDVLEKLNDQWLVNPPQFYTLLRGMKAGDEVTLTLFQGGQRKTIKAKVEEREQHVMRTAEAAFFDTTMALPGMPGTPTTVVPAERFAWGIAAAGPDPTVAATPPTATPRGRRVVTRTFAGDAQTQWADDEFTITFQYKGGDLSKVTIADKATGKVIYTGTEEGIEKEMRPNVVEKFRKAKEAAAKPMAQPLPPQPAAGPLVEPPLVEPVQVVGDPNANTRIRVLAAGPGGDVVVTGRGGGGTLLLGGAPGGGIAGGARGKVMRWQDNDHILFVRSIGNRPTYLLALSTKDGRVVYDGPVESDDQQASVPAEVAEEFKMLVAHPQQAKEFGVTAETKTTAAPAPKAAAK